MSFRSRVAHRDITVVWFRHSFTLFAFSNRRLQELWRSAPAINPPTDKSSSSSDQCSEVPPLPISYFVRCSGEALSNNGNQAIGTLMRVRPLVGRGACLHRNLRTWPMRLLAHRLFETSRHCL